MDTAAALEVRGYGARARAAPRVHARPPWSRDDLAFALAALVIAVAARGRAPRRRRVVRAVSAARAPTAAPAVVWPRCALPAISLAPFALALRRRAARRARRGAHA